MAQVQEPKEEEVIKKLVERVERQLKEGISVAWLESDSDILFDTYQANPSGQQSSTSASGATPSTGSSLQTYFENEVALKTRQALIELSANQINVVVDYLAALLDKLVKAGLPNEQAAKSQLYVLDMLVNCLQFRWDNIRQQLFSVSKGSDDMKQVEIKEEAVLPPPLDHKLTLALLTHSYNLLLSPKPPPYYANEFREQASKLLFQLSASNYEVIYADLVVHIQNPPKESDENKLSLIPYLNVNRERLAELLGKLLEKMNAGLKKHNQILICKGVYGAVWNWIEKYPLQFNELLVNKKRIIEADNMFNAMQLWIKKETSKIIVQIWPALAVLLLCCADIVSELSANKPLRQNEAKEQWLTNVKASLAPTSKNRVTATTCLIDMCRAATLTHQGSELRTLAASLQLTLRDQYFKTRLQKVSDDDLAPLIDYLVAAFNLNPTTTIKEQFSECIRNEQAQMRMVLVKSLLKIFKHRTPHHTDSKQHESLNDLAPLVKLLFTSELANYRAYTNLRANADKKALKQSEKLQLDIKIIGQLAKLVHTAPALFLHGKIDDREEKKILFQGICDIAVDISSPYLVRKGTQCLVTLHEPEHIEAWSRTDALGAYWDLGAIFNHSIGNALLRRDLTSPQILEFVSFLESVLAQRKSFLSNHFKARDAPNKLLFFRSLSSVEASLLIHLCSREPAIVSKCVTCFGHVCDEVDVANDMTSDVALNYDHYRELSQSGLLTTGPAAQQKTIQRIFRDVSKQTTANWQAWQETLDRWTRYTQHLLWLSQQQQSTQNTQRGRQVLLGGREPKINAVADPLLQQSNKSADELNREWYNYSGVLIALSGVSLGKEMLLKSDGKEKSKSKTPTQVASSASGQFMQTLVELFVADDQPIRDTITQLVGSTLSPMMLTVLFFHLHNLMQAAVTSTQQININSTYTLLIEQSILCIKKMLDTFPPHNLSLMSNIEQLLVSFAKYLSQLVLSDRALRTKIKFCNLIDAVMLKRAHITFKNENQFRTATLDAVLSWTSDYVDWKAESLKYEKENPNNPGDELDKLKQIFNDVDVANLRTAATLLRGLSFEEDKGTVEKTDSLAVKYFTYFSKLLARCKKEINKPKQLVKYTIMSLSHLLSANVSSALEYFSQMGYHDDIDTRRAFLKVITNILDQGAEFDKGEEDLRDKYEALLELLFEQNMLVIQALLQVIQITEADDVTRVLVSMCEAYTANHADMAALNQSPGTVPQAAHDEGQSFTLRLLKMAISTEISKTESPNTLFRRNSVATKLMAAYTKLIGSQYLKDTLSKPLEYLLQTPLDFEVDPTKLTPGQNREANMKNINDVSNMFLKSIISSLDACPPQLCELCHYLSQKVKERFETGTPQPITGGFGTSGGTTSMTATLVPSDVTETPVTAVTPSTAQPRPLTNSGSVPTAAPPKSPSPVRPGPAKLGANTTPAVSASSNIRMIQRTAVGGLMFLRFFCPAIVAPRNFGLVEDVPSQSLVRGLILVTKVLQNLANLQIFQKEPYMMDMNGFIQANISTMEQLFDKYAVTKSTGAGKSFVPSISEAQREEDLGAIHRHLISNSDPISKILIQWKAKQNIEARLQQLLSKLGDPPEAKQQHYRTRNQGDNTEQSNNDKFLTFMENMEGTNTDAVRDKRIFYRQGTNKEGHTLFYLISSRLSARTLPDSDVFLYYLFKTLEPHLDKPFSIVVDLTFFSKESEVDIRLMRKVIEHFPYQAKNSLKHIYFLHPNRQFRDFASKLGKNVDKVAKRFVFFNSVKDFVRLLPDASETGLPSSTLAMENEMRHSFVVLKRGRAGASSEWTLRINKSSLVMISNKPANYWGHQAAIVNTVHISMVVDALRPSNNDQEFQLKYEQSGLESITFRTPQSGQADEIVQAILSIKRGYEMTSQPGSLANNNSQLKGPGDVPGLLLNMALLNLVTVGYNTVPLRESAYNLLNALAKSFNFSVHVALLKTNGLCIPNSSSHFVTNMSRRLAETETKLTLEFLLESVANMKRVTPETKLSCLDYISPWLPNLSQFTHKAEKVREFIASLMDFTIKETMIRPAVLTKAWEKIGNTSYDTLEIVLDVLMKKAVTTALNSPELVVLGDILITLASQNSQFIAGKMITRLMNKLNETAAQPRDSLAAHQLWPAITVLQRLVLNLSFANLISVTHYLPELFHLVMMLMGTGASTVRISTYCLLVNTVHSLYTAMNSQSVPLEALSEKINEFGEAQFRLLFGIAGQKINPFETKAENEPRPAKVNVSTLQAVADALYSVLNCLLNSARTNQYLTRWLSLTITTSFTENIALQPRAFVVLGALLQHSVDDYLLERLLFALRKAMNNVININNASNPAADDADQELVTALLTCLGRLMPYITPQSKYYAPMFWLVVCLVQVSDQKLFAEAITLLEAIIRSVDESGLLESRSLSAVMMEIRRTGPFAHVLKQLDAITGISWETSFSFAVAAHLLKGLKESATKTKTSRLLMTLVQVSNKMLPVSGYSMDLLGYLSVLLPVMSEEERQTLRETYTASAAFTAEAATLRGFNIEQALAQAQLGNTGPFFFTQNLVPDLNYAALLFAMLGINLADSEKEHETLFILKSLREGGLQIPQALPITYDMLLPKMEQFIIKSTNPEVIEAVIQVLKIIFSYEMVSIGPDQKINKKYLKTIGFGGLTECTSFAKITPQRQNAIRKLAVEFLDEILKKKPATSTATTATSSQ